MANDGEVPFARGRAIQVDGREAVAVEAGMFGFVLFGPYAEFPPGAYIVDFELMADPLVPAETDDIVCILDVACDSGQRILNKTNVFKSRLRSGWTRVSLPFRHDGSSTVEFRVHSVGNRALSLLLERHVREIDPSERTYLPMLDRGEAVEAPFFHDNVEGFRHLYERGAEIAACEGRIVASSGGVRFLIEEKEDFQVANEVFFVGEYRFEMPPAICAIDIGMNVGLTSLFFASLPHIAEVHAFEPFAAPRLRALANIALNPEIGAKISVNAFGLSGRSEELTVLTESANTISTSVRGRTSGTPEGIVLREASAVVGPIIAAAEEAGRRVVMKVDCEGSEFEIFEALIGAGLLEKVSAYLVEWHKWWSPDRTQRDLIEPLLQRGFAVLDRTNMSDPYAGQLYAVRIAAA